MLSNVKRVVTLERAARFRRMVMIACVVAAVWCVWATCVPIGDSGEAAEWERRMATRVQPLPKDTHDIQSLLGRVAGACPIRPAQAVAAVKDDGAAARLLKMLKLQGVVQMGDGLVAYIQVEKEGVKTIRQGETILDFVVENVEPGKVTLSLQGVVVVLGHGS